jgi:hypothetical protein
MHFFSLSNSTISSPAVSYLLQHKALYRCCHFPATSQRQNRIPRRQHRRIPGCAGPTLMGISSGNVQVLPAITRQLNVPKRHLLIAADYVVWYCTRHHVQFTSWRLASSILHFARAYHALHGQYRGNHIHVCSKQACLPSWPRLWSRS